jgi:hypothetical protein
MADPTLLYDRYRIVRRLGSGAFATVYLADDLQMGRPVAVKRVSRSADSEGRVIREAQAAAKLSHHNILAVYEIREEPDETFLITEYIQGQTLRQYFREGMLSDADICEIGIQMSKALEHAHKRGVVHRDIKPENIMLVEGDSIDVRLMDFGVAMLEDRASITMTGDLVGTLAYMSPEQGEGKQVDSRSDVYSLALTLYEGFTGKSPFRGKKLQELLHDVSRPDIPPLSFGRSDLPPALSDALERAMNRDRYQRPDAATFGRQLAQVGKIMPESSPYETIATRVRRRFAGPRADRARLVYLGSHAASAGFALCTLIYLLPRMSFYPHGAILALVAAPAFLALVWPFAGAVLTLAVLAPPVFAYGAGWGVIYVIPAVVMTILLRWRRREWAVLLPGAIPLAATSWLGLALLPLAGVLLRRWGALAGFFAGLVLAVTAGLAGFSLLPYTFTPAPGPLLQEAHHASSPWTALTAIARFLDSRPEMSLQILLFAVLSLPLYLFLGDSRTRRMWGVCVYLVLLLAAFVLLPILALDVPVDLGRFLIAYVPCAIIAVLSALFAPAKGAGSL